MIIYVDAILCTEHDIRRRAINVLIKSVSAYLDRVDLADGLLLAGTCSLNGVVGGNDGREYKITWLRGLLKANKWKA